MANIFNAACPISQLQKKKGSWRNINNTINSIQCNAMEPIWPFLPSATATATAHCLLLTKEGTIAT